ncbi:MAG: hypothetical protein IJD85_07220 [Oscillospiraceae bacterium]|nr:hypothetical protein [Oscillospiraceae bacterium]
MATVGNMASVQYTMALVKTSQQYISNLQKNNYSSKNIFDTSTADEVLKNYVERGNDYVQEQYDKLYNSIFGSKDEDSAEKTVSVKQASLGAANSADSIEAFTNGLRYGGNYDEDSAKKLINNFVKDYNTLVESLGNSDNNSVLQKGVLLVNAAKVYSGSLGRVGISIGDDNKLSFNEDYMSEISATDLKTTFGDGGIATKVRQKSEQISRLAGSSGAFGYNSVSAPSYAYNIGALLSTYA